MRPAARRQTVPRNDWSTLLRVSCSRLLCGALSEPRRDCAKHSKATRAAVVPRLLGGILLSDQDALLARRLQDGILVANAREVVPLVGTTAPVEKPKDKVRRFKSVVLIWHGDSESGLAPRIALRPGQYRSDQILEIRDTETNNKRLQLTPNSSFQSIRGTVLAASAVPQRWWSALLGAAEPPVRWAARAVPSEGGDGKLFGMRIATGKVVQGKLELDGDSLEEGATVTVLVPEPDESFELTPDEEAALEESLKEAAQGQFVDAKALLRELRQ